MKEFYVLIRQALAGNPPKWFNPYCGLCGNYIDYLFATGAESNEIDTKLDELSNSFISAGLDFWTPFNPDGTYSDEQRAGATYQTLCASNG